MLQYTAKKKCKNLIKFALYWIIRGNIQHVTRVHNPLLFVAYMPKLETISLHFDDPCRTIRCAKFFEEKL